MRQRLKKTLLVVLRTAVCVGAMYWVLSKVTWHDWATMPDGTVVQILNWDEVIDDPRLEDSERIAEIRVRVSAAAGPTERTLGELARTSNGRPTFQIGLRTVFKNSDPGLLGLAVLIFAPVGLIQSVRFTWMVRAQEIELSHWEGIKLVYAGNFLNFVALGTTGGDIFKAYYVSCHTNRKTEAVTTVFLDRAVGLIGLIVISAVAMVVKIDDPKIYEWWPVIAGLCGALVAGGVVVFSRHVRRWTRFDQLLDMLPFSGQFRRIDAATTRMRQHKKLLLAALLLTLLLQGIAITGMIFAGFGLGMNDDPQLLAGYYVYIAMALLVAAVPITYQGGGTMDGILQIFFMGTYGNYSQILFLGLAIRLLQLLWSLPGVLVPIMGAHRPSNEKIAALQALAATSES